MIVLLRCLAFAVALLQPAAGTEAQALPVREARFVTVGGIEQWVTIRGDDRRNPVLLILHGGPGDAQSPLLTVYAPLERNFVVVQWDQRGAGRTRARAGDGARNASLESLIEDGIELTEYITGYLQTRNVVLVGHSWGSFLGGHIVKRRPELFRAFVGTGQIVSWRGTVEAQYRYALDRARADSNAAAVRELEALGVPALDKFDQYLVMRRWLNRYLAVADTDWLANQDALVRAALTTDDLAAYRQGFQTMAGMMPTVFSIDMLSLGTDFKVPFLVLQGADDHITPTALAERYFGQVTAPRKRMVLFDGAGHFAMMTHMAEFAAALSENLKPLLR